MVQLVVKEQGTEITHYLDTSDVSIKGNYSAKEIQEVAEQKSDFTQSFQLPMTDINNDFFSHFYNVNSTDGTFDSSVKTKASIYVDSNLVFEGYLQLLKVNNSTEFYDAVVFGEIANIAIALSEKKLSELDLSDFNHVLSRTNVKASWSGAIEYTDGSTGDEILYPIIDYGYNYTNDSLNGFNPELYAARLKPTIKIRTLFERILANINYTVNSSFFAEDFFDKQYMTLSQEFQTVQSSFQDGFKVGLTGNQIINPSGVATLQLSDNTTSGLFDLGGNFDTAAYEYTVPLTGWHSFRLKMKYQMSSQGSIVSTVKLKKLNNPLFSSELSGPWNGTNNSVIDIGLGVKTFDIISENLVLYAGDRLYVEITWSTAIGSVLTVYDDGTEFSLYTAPVSEELSTVELGISNTLMPQDKQVDFISAILSRYNLIIALDKDVPGQLNIEPAQDYYDTGVSLDWSDKLDNNKDIILKPTNEFRKAKINFTDLDGEGVLNTYWQTEFKHAYNSYETDLEGDFGEGLLEVKTIFESFNCTRIPGHDMLVSKGYKNDNGEMVFVNSKPQLFVYSGLKDCQEYRFHSQSDGNYTTETQYPFIHHYLMNGDEVQTTDKDIRFKTAYSYSQPFYVAAWPTTDTFARCWRKYLNNIYSEDARILTANFYLNPEDIAQFEYNSKIFIKDNYYRINKISNYALGKNVSTKVELIKLIENNIMNSTNAIIGCNLTWNVSYFNGTTGWIDENGVIASPTQECCESNNLYFDNNICYWNYNSFTEPTQPPISWEPNKDVTTTGGVVTFNPDALVIKTNAEKEPSIFLGGKVRQIGKVASDGEFLRFDATIDETKWTPAVSKIIAGTNVTISPTSGYGDVTINASGGGGGTPASPNNSVQYNDGGSFGGDGAFTFNDTTNDLTVTNTNSHFFGTNIGNRSYIDPATGELWIFLHAQDFDLSDTSRYFVYSRDGSDTVMNGFDSRAPMRIASTYLPIGYRLLAYEVYTNSARPLYLKTSSFNSTASTLLNSGTTNTIIGLPSAYTVNVGEYFNLLVETDRSSTQVLGGRLRLGKI